MPAGFEVTVPVPEMVTDSCRPNAAVTVVLVASVMLQVSAFVDVQPVQPTNTKPAAAAAVTDVAVPALNVCVQSPGQVMPVPVTVPATPGSVTVNVAAGSKFALIVIGPFIVTLHVVVVLPVHGPPSQPVKIDPAVAVAVSWIT